MAHIEQHEKLFQKNDVRFVGSKARVGRKTRGSKKINLIRNVGLGIQTPDTARAGNYVDKKCPFLGNVSIRGRILSGTVKSTKMKRTIIVRRDYLHYVPKYKRFEKRHSNIPAHCSPAFRLIRVGDTVTVGECR